jgi:hypothetical protein
MHQIARLIDADTRSLETRVQQAVHPDDPACTVTYFTYWYTGRPPVHEALVHRRPAA